jgi:ubiquinone/menaquinone biosynthesis C-methylase UbiE
MEFRPLDASGSQAANSAYYDAFSKGYEQARGKNAPRGYHELLDTLEAELVARYGAGKDVLEVGCGTGLVLERLSRFAASATGIDVSPGMLEVARSRGLTVELGSATELPFADERFDVACSFKVLAHVPDLTLALREMARVTRPGGFILAELYNPNSFRGALKRFGPKLAIARGVNEGDVFTRYHSPAQGRALTPEGCRFVTARGIRIVTPVGALMLVPGLRDALWSAEHALCDSWMSRFGGFWVAVFQKLG